MDTKFDLKKLPRDPLELRLAILREQYEIIANSTIKYIDEEFANKKELYDCIEFMDEDIIITSRSEIEVFAKVLNFPIVEALYELNEFLSRVFQGAYKAANDNLRRALELVIIGSYLTLPDTKYEKARAWLNSEELTPYMSIALKSLLKNQRIASLNNDSNWIDNLHKVFGTLSDSIHTKGRKYSLDSLQPSTLTYNSIRIPKFTKNVLQTLLNNYIQIFRNICTCVTIMNPILLVGLPLELKYGIDRPISGFFDDVQADKLWNLLVPETKPFFRKLIETDNEITSIVQYINNLPDLTEEEWKIQIEIMKNHMKPNI